MQDRYLLVVGPVQESDSKKNTGKYSHIISAGTSMFLISQINIRLCLDVHYNACLSRITINNIHCVFILISVGHAIIICCSTSNMHVCLIKC